ERPEPARFRRHRLLSVPAGLARNSVECRDPSPGGHAPIGETPKLIMAKPQSEKSRILIVEDHPLFREGLRQMIDRNASLSVCGQVPDAAAALRAVAELKPDLVLVDISLEGGSGIDLIKSLKAKYEDLPILVISMH